ncbi:MAG: hypothetical protein VX294_13480 [Candidatus Latescibacterota bacterium]|nr:hypothetical protein [Candidatus Latescibacterota bacterium]
MRHIDSGHLNRGWYQLYRIRSLSLWFICSCVILLFSIFLSSCAPSENFNVRQSTNNPWYWSYGDKTILLLGGSDDDNLFQWPSSDLTTQLDRLERVGGNIIRNTMSDRKDFGFEVYPFHSVEDGTYDLNQWNKEYWNRFERLLVETAKRKIVLQIEIWDRFDYTDLKAFGGEGHWKRHPYNPENNINYNPKDSGLATAYPGHPVANENPFFYTTPEQDNNHTVLQYQQRFVEKLLGHTLDFGHILYCIDNETSGDPKWSTYWSGFIREKASQQNKTVYITEMWDDWNMEGDQHRHTFDHPEQYDFVEVSQNTHKSGSKNWDQFLFVKNYLSNNPRPINTIKTYGAEGNKFGDSDQDGIERFWRHLLGGAAAIRFHRPDSGLGLNDKAMACIKTARKIESMVPFWTLWPNDSLLLEASENTAYVAADIGQSYVVYFPNGGGATLDVSDAEYSLELFWFEIDPATMGKRNAQFPAYVSRKKQLRLNVPGQGNWVAVLLRKDSAE